jgi:hypothetical protein
MGIKELVKSGVLEVWSDIYEPRLDDKAAPNLSDVILGAEKEPMYADAEAFFGRTYLTRSMEELLEETADALKGGKGTRIFLLTSLFGGGKTHTLMTLHHAFNNPEKLKALDERLAIKVVEAGRPQIICMDGSNAKLVPHPDEPYEIEGFTIKTIWGMLAYRLGAYAKIKHLDRKEAPAPDTELLKSVLAEVKGPVLILMDEIVHYVFNMLRSRLQDYGEKVLLFLDYLARAIESSPNTVLVVSVQAEYRLVEGQKLLFEEDVFKGQASRVLRVLTRESTRMIVPVAPDDVVKVLQRRIFKKIPENETWRARDSLHRAYRERPELFGVESDWQFSSTETSRIATAKETYPFHPKYVEVLQEFVTRNKDLQKTRDAVRITRKVVRRFLRERQDVDFIMPWHIDLRDGDIRNRVLTESYSTFRDVSNRDIVSEEGRLGSVVECSNPELAFRIATTVLLKTYTYETFKEPLKVFPDLKNTALMVYEPEVFRSEKLQPSDIETIIEEMEGRLPHFASGNGRYWFTPYPSVLEYVEKRAREKLSGPRLELHRALVKQAEGIRRREEKRKGALAEPEEVFSEKNTTITGFGDEIWGRINVEDSPTTKLLVILKPEVSEEEVRNIILNRPEEGRRAYRNTVAVICPPSQADFENLLLHTARIKASEEVETALPEYYTDKDIFSIQQQKIKRFRQENEKFLNQQILASLTRIAYPTKTQTEDDVKWVDVTPSSSIISQAEAALRDARTGPKLRINISFNDLQEFLKRNQNWDLVEGDRRFEFKDILTVFHSSTTAPFTTRNAVDVAIKQGIENLDIGILMDGTLYWKREGPQNGAEIPQTRLKDTSEILPYKLAAVILKDGFITESGVKRVAGAIHRIWYEIEIAGRRIRLEDLLTQKGWEKALKEGTILRQVEVVESGYILEVVPSTLDVKPETSVSVDVNVEPVGDYHEEVQLDADEGTLAPDNGIPPFKAKWDVGKLYEPGEYRYTLNGTSRDGTYRSSLLTVIVRSPEEEVDVERLDLTHVGAKLLSLKPKDMVSFRMALNLSSRMGFTAEVDIEIDFGEEASFTGRELDAGIAGIFIQKFDEILRTLAQIGRKTTLKGTVKFLETIALDAPKIATMSQLNERVTFRLRIVRA